MTVLLSIAGKQTKPKSGFGSILMEPGRTKLIPD